MKMANEGNILITGSHRSGTTWVGQIISEASKKIFQVYEPFNPECPPGMARPIFNSLYYHVDGMKFPQYELAAKNLLKGCFPAFGGKSMSIRSRISLVKKSIEIAFAKYRKKRFLIKSSEAMLWSEFFIKNTNSKVVMLIRHPCAFVASCERMEWGYELENLIQQDTFYSDFIKNDSEFMNPAQSNIPKRMVENTWLWIFLYRYALKLIEKGYEKNGNLLLTRHEDLCNNPLYEFQKIFSFLGIDFNLDTQDRISKQTTGNTVIVDKSTQHCLVRDSRKTAVSWKEFLDKNTIEWIRSTTSGIAGKFYENSSWNP
jgi:hypothetical protein